MTKKSMPTLSIALSTCLVCLMLSACGGSGSMTSAATTPTEAPPALDPATTSINGISVPVVPNPALATATVAGVDANSNGIRDEVDRAVAVSYGSTPTEHAATTTDAARNTLDFLQVVQRSVLIVRLTA